MWSELSGTLIGDDLVSSVVRRTARGRDVKRGLVQLCSARHLLANFSGFLDGFGLTSDFESRHIGQHGC